MKVDYVNHMGNDLTVVNAARVSFDKESEWEEVEPFGPTLADFDLSKKDNKLITYLAKHGHWTPFSHPQITLRYTVPIFVARQEFKHIVGFTRNEVSRRYVDDEPEFYVPDVWRSRPEGSVKQGSGAGTINTLCFTLELEEDGSRGSVWSEESVSTSYKWAIDSLKALYQDMLDAGVSPEQARMVLPQSMYTSYYITGSLAAFARFYRQRTDEHAQKEIQDLAHMVGNIIQPLYPVSWSALTDG